MSQYVDLTLDRQRRFLFTPFDARNVCRLLNSLPGYTSNGPVTVNALRVLLAGRDLDTWSSVLSEGLKHEDKGITHDKALKMLSEYLANGGDLVPVGQAIRQAGENSGVWEAAEDGNPRGNSDGSSTAS